MNILKLLFSALLLLQVSSYTLYAYEGEQVVQTILKKYTKNKPHQSAKDYNDTGMFFYKKKMYDEAALMFYAATEIDNRHILANYNLACVLSLTVEDDSKYELLTSLKQYDRIYYYLYTSMQNEKRMQKAKEDSDLLNIKGYNQMMFETITLTESERCNYTNTLEFVSASRFEDEITITFKDFRGDTYNFSSDEKKLQPFHFYKTNDAMPPDVYSNESLIGKKFKLLWLMR